MKNIKLEAKKSNNLGNSFEGYRCDFCGKLESEVGELICGRNSLGRDYQICKSCIVKKNIKKVGDIEQYYLKKEERE